MVIGATRTTGLEYWRRAFLIWRCGGNFS